MSSAGVGVGVTVRQLPSGQHMIIEMVPGSAAANSPIEAGELILAVNRVDCTSCSTDELADHILGPEGSVVLLQTLTQAGLSRSVNLERGAPITDGEEHAPVYRPDNSPNRLYGSTHNSATVQPPPLAPPQASFSASSSQQPSYASGHAPQNAYAYQMPAGGLPQQFQLQNPGQIVQPSQRGNTFSPPVEQHGYAAHQQQQQQQQQQQFYPPRSPLSPQSQQRGYAPQQQPHQIIPTQQLHVSYHPAQQMQQMHQQNAQKVHTSFSQQQNPQPLTDVPSQQHQLPNAAASQQHLTPTYASWTAPNNQSQQSNSPPSSNQPFRAPGNAQGHQFNHFPPSVPLQQVYASQHAQPRTSPTAAPVPNHYSLAQSSPQNPLAISSDTPALTPAQQFALQQGVNRQRQQPPHSNQASNWQMREQQQSLNSSYQSAQPPKQAHTPPAAPMSGFAAPMQAPAYAPAPGPGGGGGGGAVPSALFPGQLASVTHV